MAPPPGNNPRKKPTNVPLKMAPMEFFQSSHVPDCRKSDSLSHDVLIPQAPPGTFSSHHSSGSPAFRPAALRSVRFTTGWEITP